MNVYEATLDRYIGPESFQGFEGSAVPIGGDKIRGRDLGQESSVGGGIFPVAPLAGQPLPLRQQPWAQAAGLRQLPGLPLMRPALGLKRASIS